MSSIKVHVGTPSSDFEEWTTAEVYFHGFANLPNSVPKASQTFSCFGHLWKLKLNPGDDDVDDAESDDASYIALELCNMSNEPIEIEFGFGIRNEAGKEVVYLEETAAFGVFPDDEDSSWGYSDFAKRTQVLTNLVKGALVVEVRMKLIEESKLSSQFIPTNPLNKNILNKFNDEESADVVFEVGSGSKQGKGTRKKAKTSTNFYAHRLILQDISTTLAEMCKPPGGGSVASVSITDVKPDIFKHMLYYLYGGKLTEEDLKENAKDIIDACDKYGVVHLKLEAEVSYVNSTTLTNDNIIDNLLYADSKNLALLKEAVMDYIVAEKKSIMGKISFDNVPGSTVTDILAAVAREEESDDVSDVEDGEGVSIDYNKMRVGTLRKMLDEKGLDVDGSREAMIALLKENA